MSIDYYKKEMINRFCYLNENSNFFFNIFMKEDLSEELRTIKELSERTSSLNEYNAVDLKLFDEYTLYMFECLLFEDKPLEYTEGYKYFETLRTDPLSVDKSKRGFELILKFNDNLTNKMNFDTIELFNRIYENIARQSRDFYNKENKLKIIDEYIRIAKYSNDGVTWLGGYFLNNIDRLFNPVNFRYYVEGKDLSATRMPYDVGVQSNPLIEITKDINISNEEKKALYFKYHDEIPYDLNILCGNNGILEINRPQLSKPCNRSIELNKQDIFSLERDKDYVFLTLCPSCLYIVGVKANLIPLSMQEEIIWNNKKNSSIYKESYLKSELKSLSKTFGR